MIFSSPPQFGQCSRSRSKTRLSKRVQLGRTDRCPHMTSSACGCAAWVSSGSFGTTCARSFAFGQCRAGDVTAQSLQRLALVGAAAYPRVQAEAFEVGAQILFEVHRSGQRAL